MIEKDIRDVLKKEWPYWCDWLEPRGNAGIGRPDWDILVAGAIAPVELKIGRLVGENSFRPEKIRPDQVSWHHRFYSGGGVSFFMFAESKTDIWIARRIIDVSPDYKVWVFDHSVKLELGQLAMGVMSFVTRSRKKA